MKHGDFYQHFKGGEYFFDSIALPLSGVVNTRSLIKNGVALDAHTPENEEVQELQLYRTPEGLTLIASPYPHVIYQSEKDYDTEKVWARKVDDFFGIKEYGDGSYHKRFTLKERR